jgi:hypothetical protein
MDRPVEPALLGFGGGGGVFTFDLWPHQMQSLQSSFPGIIHNVPQSRLPGLQTFFPYESIPRLNDLTTYKFDD